MKKIFYVIFIIFFSVSCGKDDKDLPLNSLPEDSVTGDDWFNATGCRPSDASKIKQGQLYGDSRGCKYLYGSKYIEEVESFWFAKYDQSGNEIWEIIHKDNSFKSHSYNPVELKNGNIVIGNVLKETDFECVAASPVIVDKSGNANYLKVFDNKYIYSDVSVYDDFFFTTVSQKELYLNKNATNRAAQIDNEGKVMRLFPGGTDQLHIPQKEDKYIWFSDSTYASMNLKSVINSSIFKTLWERNVNIQSCESCEMYLGETDTTIIASYFLKYNDGSKDTIVYDLYKDSGKEVWRPVSLQGIAFSETEKKIKMGEYFMIKPIFIPENATNKKLIWKSSNESIAKVDNEGLVKSISFGECNISAISEDGNFVASCKIVVLEPEIEEAIKVSVYGSSTSTNGYTTGNVTAAFYNNSSREVEVLEFVMYNTKTNKKVFYETNCGFVKYRNPLKYDLSFELVYKPLYVWRYKIDGKIYEIKYQLGN